MRSWQMFVTVILGATAFSAAVADEAVRRVEDTPEQLRRFANSCGAARS